MGKSKPKRVKQTPDEVLFVFGAAQPAGHGAVAASSAETRMKDGEIVIKEHLEKLGYTVAATSDNSLQDQHIAGKSLVIVSSTAEPQRVGNALRLAEIPIIVANSGLFAYMGMTTGNGARSYYGSAAHDEPVMIYDPQHPMAAGLTESTTLTKDVFRPLTKPMEEAVKKFSKLLKPPGVAGGAPSQEGEHGDGALIWGIPDAAAIKIAVLERHQERAVVFGYELCAKMVGLYAPARRVGLFLDQGIAPSLTPQGWALFDAAVKWAVRDEAKPFTHVFKLEWREIQRRRSLYSQSRRAIDGCQPPDNLVGLALSGGGIRSATFCLGLLQGLHELKFLHVFDYLSTVSGGGYLGGWWSAWLSRPNSLEKGIFPKAETIELDRGRSYLLADQAKRTDAALKAGEDPIHHLRLFANYLTPRKGLLSADTWRAIAIITRNIVLTWLILLPILGAFVLAGQLYFTLHPESPIEFAFPYGSEIAKNNKIQRDAQGLLKQEREKESLGQNAFLEAILLGTIETSASNVRTLEAEHNRILLERARRAALPILPLVGWMVYMIGIWMMRNTRGSITLVLIGGIVVWVLLGSALFVYQRDTVLWFLESLRSDADTQIAVGGWLLVAFFLWLHTCWMAQPLKNPSAMVKENRREVQVNRIMRVHVRLLLTLVVTVAVLALGGFGHEVVEYIFQPGNRLIVQAGGWTAIASAIAGSIFTAVKGSPMGGGDPRASSKPSLISRIVFAITPPLVLLVLAFAAAWLSRWALYYVTQTYAFSIPALTFASFVGVTLWLLFAGAEINWRKAQSHLQLWIVCVTIILLCGGVYLWHSWMPSMAMWIPLTIIILASSLIFTRILVAEAKDVKDDKQRHFKFAHLEQRLEDERPENYRLFARWLMKLEDIRLTSSQVTKLGISCAVLLMTGIALAFYFNLGVREILGKGIPPDRLRLVCAASTGLAVCIALVIFEVFRGEGLNRRSLWLLRFAYLVLTTLLVINVLHGYVLHPSILFVHAAVGLLATVFGWVVALGWMADPNALSLHTFYKGRLVRAYMGASNPNRSQQREITDTVENDDVLLKDLRNCPQGAPYHLINTTLNLVGGRDLTTAQRSSAAFVLSKLYCGSSRTGYRETEKYMNGRLFLGAAVAASGAAVSPNMGSLRTSASLAVLMTLLNVRLGYWAPTPNKDSWRSSQTRLWPFYMLRESLSQTNDLSTYCYLTDGGHFENTGLYSLVERGCRYIVLSDGAADPSPCFADLGNAIRRCRIDFKTEITLDITSFIKKSKEDRFASHHYAVGEIKYSEEHVKKLGWTNTSPEKLTGVIVYIKPALLREDKDMTPDVRQYEIENEGFPQQTTADQWFDEAQFESYRQLGYHSAKAAFGKLELDKNCAYHEAFKKQQQRTTLLTDEKILVDAKQASDQIRSGQFFPDDIEKVFDFFYAYKPQKPPENS